MSGWRRGQEVQVQREPQAAHIQGLGIGTRGSEQGRGPASWTLGPDRARDSQGLICTSPHLMLVARPHM